MMPEQYLERRSESDGAEQSNVSPKLLKKIGQTSDPLTLLNFCLEEGEALLQIRPRLPRRILHLASVTEDQGKADVARIGVAENFPESLRKFDLAWLRRLGLRDQEIQTIKAAISTNQVAEARRIRLVRRLFFLGAFDSMSAAFDNYAAIAEDDPQYRSAHVRALFMDRRFLEAREELSCLEERFAGTEHEWISQNLIFSVAENYTGFETIPGNSTTEEDAATATHRLNQIAVQLNNRHAEEIEGWRRLEDGIIYRRGVLDTALIIFPGPQTVENAEAWTRAIEECNRLGIGQVCLHRRLDRHLTGLGPWKGRPEVTINLLVEALRSVGFRRFATAGASGTSLAATIAGAEINAAGILLLPAVTHFPDPETEPDPRAARAAAREFRYLPPGVYDAQPFLKEKTVPVWAHVPGQSDFDRRQIDHLADYPYLHIVVHDCKEHGILPWLAQRDQLEPVISQFLDHLGWIDR